MKQYGNGQPTPKMKKYGIAIFLSIVFLPAILTGVSEFTEVEIDVKLKGYTDDAQKPELHIDGFWSGEYQNAYTTWFDAHIKPRGVLTKTHATIRYNLFNQGNRPIGNDGDVFDNSYIQSGLVLAEKYDMSLPPNRERMETYVNNMVLLQEKLAEHGKYLYVYIAADKVTMRPENVPQQYWAMRNPESISPVDYFSELMGKTSIPYLNTKNIGEMLEYPAYYTTGIHWSRPFEQRVSQRIVADMIEITGKNYKPLQYGEVMTSSEPFYRDSDLFDTLNVWNDPAITYYEYSIDRTMPAQYDKVGVLMSGTSFCEGLRRDILNAHPAENVYMVNRSNYMLDPSGNHYVFNGNWSELDLTEVLDNVDVVVIENISPELINCSYGFVEYMLEVLEGYTPAEKKGLREFDASSDMAPDAKYMNGFWGKENGFVWIRKEASIVLQDSEITQNGLRLEFDISDVVIDQDGAQNVHVYINGQKVTEQRYEQPGKKSIIIPAEELVPLQQGKDLYDVTIMCSGSVVPKNLGLSNDSSELALMLTYIGREE